jgi:hypothetical protein
LNKHRLLISALLCPLGFVLWLVAYSDGPPLGHTGGFGEPTCHACHFDNPLLEWSDSLVVDAPRNYVPNEIYVLNVSIFREEMKSAGFQLSVRFRDSGQQAGTLQPLDTRTSLVHSEDQALQYLQHSREGQQLNRETGAAWRFQWDAPNRRAPVAIDVAANASNHDDSEFGDFIYTQTATIVPVQ